MGRTHALLLTAPFALGCNIEGNVGGLADSLLDPDPSSLDSPGRQIAKGSYAELELDASLAVGARLLALRSDREESELAIIPFEGGEACHVGPATRFMRLASQVDVNLTPIVGYLGETANGRGRLEFVDFDCKAVMDPIEDVGLPQVLYPRSKATGLLTLSGSGNIYFIDVTKPEVRVVAESVRSGRVGNDYLWVVKDGVLIALGDDFEEVTRYGSNVETFALFSGLEEPGVTNAAYVEDGKLWLSSATDDEPRELAEDVCNLTDIGAAGAFAFYSPCAERQLNLVYNTELAGEKDPELLVTRLAARAIDPGQVELFWGDGYGAALFLVDDDEKSTSGDLVFQVFEGKSGEAEEAQTLEQNAHINAGGIVLLNYESGVGSLAQAVVETNDAGRPELKSLDTLVDGVAQLPGITVSSNVGVLGNYDSKTETGDLLLFSQDLSKPPESLVSRVPIQRHARDAEGSRSAFVGDFDGRTGTAYLLEKDRTTALGDAVLPSTLQFVELPESVAYLTNSGSRDRALTLYLLEPELEVVVSQHVNEFHALPWPSPGILYSVDEGSDQGLWFARAK